MDDNALFTLGVDLILRKIGPVWIEAQIGLGQPTLRIGPKHQPLPARASSAHSRTHLHLAVDLSVPIGAPAEADQGQGAPCRHNTGAEE
jgi:hypothetical protein